MSLQKQPQATVRPLVQQTVGKWIQFGSARLTPPSGAAFMHLGMELPLSPNQLLQPFSFVNLGMETLC